MHWSGNKRRKKQEKKEVWGMNGSVYGMESDSTNEGMDQGRRVGEGLYEKGGRGEGESVVKTSV